MLEPFSLLPLALAAHGGMIDEYEAQQLVAAGVTLLQRSAALVRALSAKRSAFLLPTSPQFLTALAASEGRGAVLINPLASRHEIAHQLRDAGVGAVFTNTALARHLPDPSITHVLLDDAPRTATVIAAGGTRAIDLGTHHGLSLEGETDVPGSEDEVAIVYTSAMEGTPLGAVVTHRNLLSNARATLDATGDMRNDTVLAALPFAHLFGLTVSGTAPLLSGGKVITMPRFNPSRTAELIATGAISVVVGVPAVFRALLSAIEKREVSTVGRLRLCICGGAPLEVSLQDRWFDATGVELRQGYGLTEAGPVCLFNRVDRPNARGTLGSPLAEVDVRITQQSEIVVRGANVFRGYVSNGDAGLRIDSDGWLHTGDAGRANADGTISFVDVVKPMFTRNGFNIYPRELETAIAELSGVARVAVRAVAHPGAEPEIEARVTGAVSADAVRAWCAERLSAYKQPTTILISES
jgi:long-chain acyl-CoA synthetase